MKSLILHSAPLEIQDVDLYAVCHNVGAESAKLVWLTEPQWTHLFIRLNKPELNNPLNFKGCKMKKVISTTQN